MLGQLHQAAAAGGLHDDNRLAVACGHLHAAARLHHWVVPIQVVHLQLHEVGVGVRREQRVERLRAVVHGEAPVADAPGRLLLAYEIPHAVLVELGRARAAHVVQQVEVDVVGAQTLKRRA